MIKPHQIENLENGSCSGFLNSQFNRFEIYESKQGETDYSLPKKEQAKRELWIAKNFPDNQCVMKFYDENCYDLGELYSAVKFACEQSVYDGELSVTMTVKNEY